MSGAKEHGAYAGVHKKKRDRDKKPSEKKKTKKSSKKGEKEKVEIPVSEETNIRIGNYQMLEPIGKGGFGTVYRGLNLRTGATVAVKRVNLHGIPKEELEGIEMEIKLLQNLSHPNIVKYIDAIRSDDYLNIVLEFVENGALSNLLSKLLKHGYVEEQLVAVYTYQILEGLKYLHQQGVIHRDIKGANILSTKDGIVKLADFGVATKLNDSRKSDSVVGTPYWMAPEIIEMTGQQSSACDIWSVGCTVVELITGKPPYFDLQQMPALFRIVQDEHPPLPDNISQALEDFLMQCFQKDPIRRILAADLLKHPWLRSAQQNFKEEARIRLLQDAETKAKSAPDSSAPGPRPDATVTQKRLQPSITEDDMSAFDDDDDEKPPQPAPELRARGISIIGSDMMNGSKAPPSEINIGPMMSGSGANKIDAYAENDNDQNILDDESEENNLELDAVTTIKKKAWDDPEPVVADDAEDVFGDLDFEAPDPRSDQEVKTTKAFMRLLNNLSPKEDEETIIKACGKLTEMLTETRELTTLLMTAHGPIPIMEMLEVPNPTVIVAILKLINQVIGTDIKFQQSMSLVGLIPAIVKYASPGFPSQIRLEAANFVRHFCYATEFTRKMFIACGGLPVLVGFLEEQYTESRTLVYNAIDCIRHVFDVSTNPKNDFCRLFCKYGLLPPLAKTLTNINADKEHPQSPEYTKKVAEIIHLFSQGDGVVKQYLAHTAVQEEVLRSLPVLSPEVLLLILKSIRNISMDSNSLDLLEAAGAIPALIPFMTPQYPDNVQNQVLLSMYYLSTIKASRQEQAARSGIIPHLQRFIVSNHALKQFAFPLIFQLAKTSKRTRTELRKHDGVSFFLNLLEETYWKSHALEALASWLSDPEDARRVEYKTLQHIGKLVSVMRSTKKSEQFDKILGPLEKILQVALAVNRGLGASNAFVDELIHRITFHADNNAIRVHLLKMLTSLLEHHKKPAELAERTGLVPLLQNLAGDKNAVVVAQLAQTLLADIAKINDPDGAAGSSIDDSKAQ